MGELGENVSAAPTEIIEALLRRPYRLRSFVVFGSRARGDWRPWSDTDVVIIIDGLDRPPGGERYGNWACPRRWASPSCDRPV